MIKSMPFSWIIALFVVMISIAYGMPQSTQTNQGDPSPLFHLRGIDGKQIALQNLTGEKVYIKYWASWCSVCLAGLDEINTLAGEDNDFRVLTIVTPDYKGEMSAKNFKAWFKELDMDHMTVLLDENRKWAKEFGVFAYPSSYYIGSDSIFAKSFAGHHANETIKHIMEDIPYQWLCTHLSHPHPDYIQKEASE